MGAPKLICSNKLQGLEGGSSMSPIGYSAHTVSVIGESEVRTFTRAWEAGEFLLPWSYMDPTVASCEWTGPQWEYQCNGRRAVAKVPLTVTLRTGEVEYRDFVDERFGQSAAVPVKREHCRLERRGYRLFDYAFYEANLVEVTNRKHAYFLLLNATRGNLLANLEVDVLVGLAHGSRTLSELAEELGLSPVRVRAAVLSLWRQGRVQLPMSDTLINDTWQVRRLSDGAV
jgi:hypothetical protein